jgi:hypothetical protein
MLLQAARPPCEVPISLSESLISLECARLAEEKKVNRAKVRLFTCFLSVRRSNEQPFQKFWNQHRSRSRLCDNVRQHKSLPIAPRHMERLNRPSKSSKSSKSPSKSPRPAQRTVYVKSRSRPPEKIVQIWTGPGAEKVLYEE